MTREEAWRRAKGYLYDALSGEEADEIIKALEQEPSGDLISRQAVMDCFKKWQPYMATRLWDFEQELSALPSINPQPCEDAISRQAVLDLCDKRTRYDIPFEYYEGKKHIRGWDIGRIINMNKLIELPSVKPQERTGHWIFEGNQCFSCSSCGRIYTQKAFEYLKLHKDDPDFPNNCPNCGIRMVDTQEYDAMERINRELKASEFLAEARACAESEVEKNDKT